MLRIAILLVMIAIVTIFVLPIRSTAQDAPAPVIALPDPAIIDDMFGRINALRERRGLPPYALSAELNTAAQNQANWLVETGLRRHFRPGGNAPSDRVLASGFVFEDWCCGENYYMSIDATPDMVWTFWRYSPSHLVNMIHRGFTHVGVGMATNGTRHAYVTVFAQAAGSAAARAAASGGN